ncbi:PBP1A family penicillin-binding protein [Desemzia sp. RIT 804]|uniref:PBP1A family penicillin-binding protein n=1 Tax=Desemzia sp. RIT 804 TaxID=2810209 RepID=UPI001F31C8E1|nr:PBP1A family penicillin-binding protein [Desemzia sp. RIT 804]
MKEKLKIYLKQFWNWLLPYLLKFKNHVVRFWRRFHVGKILILLGLILSLFATISLYIYAKVEDVEDLKAGIEEVTKVYDIQGEEAGALYSQRGTFVSLDHMTPELIDAVIATEDNRFYTHKGFDIIGIGRAAVQYVINGGQISGGGSTITQQLAKNSFLTLDQTMTRKLKELFLSIEIEKEYTKDEILEMYFNKSYFGNGVWGVEDASQKYFGKSASELNLSESTTLVGILKNPSSYNPIDSMEKALGRRDIVLSLMVNNEAVTQETASAVQQESLALADNFQKSNGYKYPYYFDSIIREAELTYGFSEEEILSGGYKIYTSLDQTYQQELDQVYQNDAFFDDANDGTLLQSASIMLDSKTGGVLAIIGGRGEHVFRGYNRATQSKLQPGSVLKPLSIYTPALERNYEIDSMLPDEEGLTFGEDNYSVSNWNHQYLGEVPLYEALADSLNVPAVWLLNDIGLNTGIKSLSKFGIEVSKQDKNLSSIALGGMSTGISPMKIASAYTALANGGVRSEGYFITKIVDSTGAVVVDNTKPKQNKATSPEIAEEMTSLLMSVFTNGTGKSNKPAGYTIAGKTGSTQLTFENNTDGTKDQWTVGYTPDIVLTTWMGFDNTDEEHYMTTSSATGVGPLFKAQMENILPETPLTAFETKSAEAIVAEKAPQDNWTDNLQESVDYWKEKVNEGVSNLKDKTANWLNGLLGN